MLTKIASWAGLVLAAIALVWVGFMSPVTPAADSNGGDLAGIGAGTLPVGHVERTAWSFPFIAFQSLANGNTVVGEDWDTMQVQPGSNVASWTNTTGKVLYVDYCDTTTTGVASSTYRVYGCYASSTQSIAASHNFTALTATTSTAIKAWPLATSTTATTTDSVISAVRGLGFGTVIVYPNWKLYTYIQQDTTNASIACAAAGKCETATSTRRGIGTITSVFRYHF